MEFANRKPASQDSEERVHEPDQTGVAGGKGGKRGLPVRIVLVRPQGGGNIGSVARVMANFGLSDLVLVAPRADPLGEEARAMACSAQDLLEEAMVVPTLPEAVAGCQWVCGATARVGERRRAGLTPRTADPEILRHRPAALVFGPEDTGLSGEDLDRCHAILTIPTASRLQSLNLAQAVAVVAYETWMADQGKRETQSDGAMPRGQTSQTSPTGQTGRTGRADRMDPSDRATPAPSGGEAEVSPLPFPGGRPDRLIPTTAEELEAALAHLQQALEAVGYFRQSAPEHPMRELRRFLARAHPSRYEIAMLRGICRRTLNTLRHRPRPDKPGTSK